jgi:hypothetical protein
MGLLDDAIREHLDLKRRRGADPMEVERAEREALGPVRRAPEAPAGDETADPASSFAYDQEADDDGWTDDTSEHEHEHVGESRGSVAEPEPVDEPDDLFEDDVPEFETEAHEAEDTESDSEFEDHAGGETIEYDVEQALGSEHHREEPRGDDDVLEETPEFLQDTPDHDRLWFEQRPPKDFDFDG